MIGGRKVVRARIIVRKRGPPRVGVPLEIENCVGRVFWHHVNEGPRRSQRTRTSKAVLAVRRGADRPPVTRVDIESKLDRWPLRRGSRNNNFGFTATKVLEPCASAFSLGLYSFEAGA
jgi:hypothetical protein